MLTSPGRAWTTRQHIANPEVRIRATGEVHRAMVKGGCGGVSLTGLAPDLGPTLRSLTKSQEEPGARDDHKPLRHRYLPGAQLARREPCIVAPALAP